MSDNDDKVAGAPKAPPAFEAQPPRHVLPPVAPPPRRPSTTASGTVVMMGGGQRRSPERGPAPSAEPAASGPGRATRQGTLLVSTPDRSPPERNAPRPPRRA